MLHEGATVIGPTASIASAITTDASGTFAVAGLVPLTLFGEGARGNLHVVPGQYTVTVRQGTTASASIGFTVGEPDMGALIWGEIAHDLNASGGRDSADMAADFGVAIALISTTGDPRQSVSDSRGRYIFMAPAGSYSLRADVEANDVRWTTTTNVTAVEQQMTRADLLLIRGTPTAPVVPHDSRYFVETRFRIDNDRIWEYFNARGGIDIFGFPVSRTFTLLGCTVQVFQREIAQVCPGQGVQLMNVLDELFPYTRVNFATFPDVNMDMKNATPGVDEPAYDRRILDFVETNAPNTFSGQRVNFGTTFFSLITPQMTGLSDPGLLAMTNLEVWGAPISPPVFDPSNADFVYQRFQRGIMHHIASQQVTRGVLLADYVKMIMKDSSELPIDLREQARGGRLLAQYCPGSSLWLCRPSELPGTDLSYAFEVG